VYPTVGDIPLIGIEVRSYQVMRWGYFLAAAALTAHLNSRQGVKPWQTLGAFLVGIPAALVGGHLLNVLEAWPFYEAQPARILDVVRGGNSIYGALIGGVSAGVWYLHWQGLPMRSFLDAAAPAMALGEAMTRVGCFLNGCCFGQPTDSLLGVSFPRGSQVFIAHATAQLIPVSSSASLSVHPTQLYSATIATAMFLTFAWMSIRSRRPFPGTLFCAFLIGYGLQRLVVGWWRADTALYWWEFSRPLSILMVIVGAVLWRQWRRSDVTVDDIRAASSSSGGR